MAKQAQTEEKTKKSVFARIWENIEHNRFTVLALVFSAVLAVGAYSCTPTVQSPISGQVVGPAELQTEFRVWQKKVESESLQYEAAAEDIERQAEQIAEVQKALVGVVNTVNPAAGGLLTTILGSGVVGLFADNIRKNGVIGGLKRNRRR